MPRFGRYRVLLRAFAGRRRFGDVQHYLDRACAVRGGHHVTTISVDLVINRSHGNLALIDVLNFWIKAIRSGAVVGLLCGPPCNTWSRARGHKLVDATGTERDGPHILRTISEAWVLPDLTIRELDDDGHSWSWHFEEAALCLSTLRTLILSKFPSRNYPAQLSFGCCQECDFTPSIRVTSAQNLENQQDCWRAIFHFWKKPCRGAWSVVEVDILHRLALTIVEFFGRLL